MRKMLNFKSSEKANTYFYILKIKSIFQKLEDKRPNSSENQIAPHHGFNEKAREILLDHPKTPQRSGKVPSNSFIFS